MLTEAAEYLNKTILAYFKNDFYNREKVFAFVTLVCIQYNINEDVLLSEFRKIYNTTSDKLALTNAKKSLW